MTSTHCIYLILTVVTSALLAVVVSALTVAIVLEMRLHGYINISVLIFALIFSYRYFYCKGKKMLGFKYASENE